MGIHRTDLRKRLDATDLIYELRDFTLKDLADRYNTTINMIHTVLSNQLKESIDNAKKRFNKCNVNFEDELINGIGTGAWMLSKERKSIREYNN